MNKLGGVLVFLFVLASCATLSEKDVKKIDAGSPYLKIDLAYNPDVYWNPIPFFTAYPTYVIWIEEQSSGQIDPVYITRAAGENDWTFVDSRPEAVPVWYGVAASEKSNADADVDAVSGATPKGEMTTISWQVPDRLLDKTIDIFIEANNSHDFNAFYDDSNSASSGQPSLVWKTTLRLSDQSQENIEPELVGHGHPLGINHQIDPDVSNVTTALDTFKYMAVSYIAKHSDD